MFLALRSPLCPQSGPPLPVPGTSRCFPRKRLPPSRRGAPVSHRRGPRRREDAFVLDHELELQILAPIVRVPDPLGDEILLCVPFEPLFRGLVIKQPISLDHEAAKEGFERDAKENFEPLFRGFVVERYRLLDYEAAKEGFERDAKEN